MKIKTLVLTVIACLLFNGILIAADDRDDKNIKNGKYSSVVIDFLKVNNVKYKDIGYSGNISQIIMPESNLLYKYKEFTILIIGMKEVSELRILTNKSKSIFDPELFINFENEKDLQEKINSKKYKSTILGLLK